MDQVRIVIERNVTRFIKDNRVDAIINNVRQGNIGPDFVIGNNGDTLLHIAIRHKRGDVVSALLNILNASITIRNNRGETAFFSACERGLIYFVKMFLRWRQNYATYLDVPDNNGMTPLLIAHSRLNKPICEHLILKGADFNQVSMNGYYIDNFQLTYRRVIELRLLNTHHRVTSPIRTFESPQPITTVRRKIGFTPCVVVKEKETSSHLKNEYIDMLIELEKTCGICFEPYQKDKVVILKNCEHSVCISCFQRLNICHMCIP